MSPLNFLSYIVLSFFLFGCGGGSSTSEHQDIIDSPIQEILQPIVAPAPEDESSDEEPVVEDPLDENDMPTDPISQNSVLDEPYFKEQWSIYEDARFYRQKRITQGASIMSGDTLNTYRGRGVKIAIIDDGLDMNHEDLEGSVVSSYDLNTKTSNVTHTNTEDTHGTAVTGIAAARVNTKGIAGVASESQIIFLKFKPFMSDSEIIELFDRAASMGADIINNSWGTGSVSPAFRQKIIDLATNGRGGRGISIVFAAGNDGLNIDGDEASIPEVIAVGATNKDNLVTNYSNYGTNLDIVAPGGEYLGITTLDPSGSSGIASIEENYLLYNDSNGFVGTSAAAPIVSGIIAMMLEKNPNLTRVEIENILKNTADKIGGISYDASGHNDYYGHGKVNLTNAMNEL